MKNKIDDLIDTYRSIKEKQEGNLFQLIVTLGNGYPLKFSWSGATPKSLKGVERSIISKTIKNRLLHFKLPDSALQEIING